MSEIGDRLSIKQWAVEDRPREKMLLKGLASLSDAELLAILIGSGNDAETAVELAQRILNDVSNNLNFLGKKSLKELMSYKGIGSAKAVTIAAALELGRRRGASEPLQRKIIRSSRDVFEFFSPRLSDIDHEQMWVAMVNNASKVIDSALVSRGGVSETQGDIRMILRPAIIANCYGIILCHNHPSGNTRPSTQDDNLTTRVAKASGLMNITLLDHIIIADNRYYSYSDEGRI
ncbi:MAG: DNA repair protein RadC [Tannerella sp.]|jgi:DNA repair protein RadC|nr:DNA repair protein RadC [Tannerella sp.]